MLNISIKTTEQMTIFRVWITSGFWELINVLDHQLKWLGCNAARQEVGRCRTRGESDDCSDYEACK